MVKTCRLFLFFLIICVSFFGCGNDIDVTSPSDVEVETDPGETNNNTVNLNPIINGTEYQLGEVAGEGSPFGEPLKNEEKYYNEIWAGSWWLEEYYDGVIPRWIRKNRHN